MNVIENLSKYFGIDVWYMYIEGFKEEFCTIYQAGLFGLCFLTVRQLFGNLRNYNESGGSSRIPSILIYIVTYLAILSSVDHKELRFYAPVAQLGCFAQGYAFVQIWNIKRARPLFKYLTTLLMAVDGIKLIWSLICYSGIYYSMQEPYLLFG